MRMSPVLVDLTATGIAFLLAFGLSVSWLFELNQEVVHKTARNVVYISIRLCALFLPIHILLSLSGVSTLWIYPAVLIIFFADLFYCMGAVSHFVSQWILGWPDYNYEPEGRGFFFPVRRQKGAVDEEDMVTPEPPNPMPNVHEELVGATGEALTRLTPTGKIHVLGTKCDARTQGSFVGRGDRIQVIGSDAFGLIVKELSTESGE